MLKHTVLWYSEKDGMQMKKRASHTAMEKLVNKVIKSDDYVKGTCKVFVALEELKPSREI
jgi:hypothetical protein